MIPVSERGSRSSSSHGTRAKLGVDVEMSIASRLGRRGSFLSARNRFPISWLKW